MEKTAVPYNQLKSHQLPPFIKLKNTDGTTDVYYSIFYDGVPNELQKIAQEELSETEEKKKKGMQRLREVVKREKISGIADYMLLSCLRKCKYNINKAETQLIKYWKNRHEMFDMLKKTDMKRLEHVLDHMVVGLLPYRDKKGRAIFFTTPNINLQLFDVDDATICYHLNLAFLMSFPMTSIAGIVYIAEAKTPAIDIMYEIMKKFRQHLPRLTNFPGRLACIEILNEMFIVRWTLNIIKPIVSGKIVGRINFHGSDVTTLRKTYHPELLPEEFGGTMGPLSNTFYKEELLNFIKKLKNEHTICNDY